MSTQLKLRRGTTAQHSTFTGAIGEITIDTDKKTVVVHDGTTPGGRALSQFDPSGSNRIINGDFEIKQRGVSFALSGTAQYTSDRWLSAVAGTATFGYIGGYIGGSAGAITAGSGGISYGFLQQRIESSNVSMLVGSKVTVSGYIYNNSTVKTVALAVLTPSATDNHTTQNTVETFTITANASSWTYFSKTLSNNLTSEATKGLAVRFDLPAMVNTEGLAFDFIQLEKGSVATPFEFRPYGTELALCQRYYWRHTSSDNNYSNFGLGYAISTTSGYVMIQNPVPMRVGPTSIEVSAGTTFNYNYSSNPTITANSLGVYIVVLQLTGLANVANGYSLPLFANNTSSAYIGVLAEL